MSLSDVLRMLGSDESMGNVSPSALFNIAIAVIFAREVLEGAVIVGQYRTVIQKSDMMNDERKAAALRTVTRATILAITIAAIVVICVAVPLGLLSRGLNERVVSGIEGGSKLVAAVCILQFSLKMPLWMNVYKKVSVFPCKKYDPVKGKKNVDSLTLTEIRFNIIWNIWRETAECGVFLIPFFLGTGAKAIPLSAIVGIAISGVLGTLIYIGNNRMKNKGWLVFVMSSLTLFLSVGMFVGSCSEFEQLWGQTPYVWYIHNPAVNDMRFPFVLLVPFGWSSDRTVLQICSFWIWLFLGCLFHLIKWRRTQWVIQTYGDDNSSKAEETAECDKVDDVEKQVSGSIRTERMESGSSDDATPESLPDALLEEGVAEVSASIDNDACKL